LKVDTMKTVSLRTRLGIHALNMALLSSTMFSAPAMAQEALPTGGQVVSGSATIATNGTSMEINQSSDRMIANWQSFSIGEGNSVTFNQPNTQSVALNRVIGQDPSRILGRLNANGQVFLLNPNGIVIGKGGQVQTGGFVGSTLGLSNADFLNGTYHFTGAGGSIFNQGDFKGGVVALIAPRVVNEGTITGNTALAAGTDVTLDFDGDGLIAVEVGASSLATLVENKGLIQADGGIAILTAKGANDALKGVVNNTGTIEAQSLASRDGRILLLGDMENGRVNAAGTLQASFVETSAAKVNIADDLQVKTGGGTWLIDPTDFTIAASGGDMTGTTLSSNLANGNVEITTLGRGSDSDIYVNDSVTWSAHTLTLDADRNITINAPLYGSGTAGLVLEYAQRSATGDYFINAPVNLASTGNFTTWNGNLVTSYTIITSLGTESSSGDATLQGMRGDLDGNYVLGSDIDASGTSSWNGGAGFDPIAGFFQQSALIGFAGNFDGLGHTISDLYINRSDRAYVGLFGYIYDNTAFGRDAYVANFSLDNVNIVGGQAVGGLAGGARDALIRNTEVTGQISGRGDVGGLLGNLLGTVEDSHTNINVIATDGGGAGGLVGSFGGGTIRQSSATGTATGGDGVGGLAGSQGYTATLQQSYSTTDVSGNSLVGGLVGINEGTIEESYAAGHVMGTIDVGGLVGRNDGMINPTLYIGPALISNSFFDVQTTGQSNSCGNNAGTCNATGLTTAQMKDAANFIAAGWDFTNVWAIDPSINNGYPHLRAMVAPVVAPPPPPPPPPPPVTTLTVDGIAASYSATSAPYQETITLSGTGFSSVTEVRFTWTDPNGQTGTVTWDASNSFGGGRFVVSSDTSATIAPVLVAAGDPAGTYQWSVTFAAGAQSITKNFAVSYAGVVTPPPPPPPPLSMPLSLTGEIADISTSGPVPYSKPITVNGQGLDDVTSVTLDWIDPTGATGTKTWTTSDNFEGKFVPSADGTMATLTPTLVFTGDPPGAYSWTITFNSEGQSPVSRSFRVNYGAPQLEAPVPNSQGQPTSNSGIWGVNLNSEVPSYTDTTIVTSTPAMGDALSELRQRARLLNSAESGIEIYEAYSGLVDAIVQLQDINDAIRALNELGLNTDNIAKLDKIGNKFFVIAANLLLDKAYADATEKGISMPIPKPVAKALLNNAIYISTGDLSGSLSDLGGQFKDIAIGYLSLTSQNATIVANELESAVLEIDSFSSGKLSYDAVMKQIEGSKQVSQTLTERWSWVWNASAAEQITIIADLQGLKVRQLNGESTTALISELHQKYSDSKFSNSIAAQFGISGW